MTGDIADGRPRAGQSVEIHDAEGKSSLGRVQSASAASVVVAVGTTAAVALSTEPSGVFDVVWPGPGGVLILPATLTQRQGASQLELWEFAPAGETRFEQRRQRTRIAASGAVTLTMLPAQESQGLPGPAAHPPLSGTLLDLSDAALQCVIPAGADDPVVTTGTQVVCDFAPDGSRFTLRGVVHAAWTVGTPSLVRVVVQFDPDQPDAAALAAFVAGADRDTDEP